MAVTVRTSSYTAGTVWGRKKPLATPKSRPSLPAATTYSTPALTDLQMARCSASLLLFPQLALSEPPPPRLMLTTLIVLACAVTWSIPQMMLDQEPEPALSSTLTGTRVARGATPTTPV